MTEGKRRWDVDIASYASKHMSIPFSFHWPKLLKMTTPNFKWMR